MAASLAEPYRIRTATGSAEERERGEGGLVGGLAIFCLLSPEGPWRRDIWRARGAVRRRRRAGRGGAEGGAGGVGRGAGRGARAVGEEVAGRRRRGDGRGEDLCQRSLDARLAETAQTTWEGDGWGRFAGAVLRVGQVSSIHPTCTHPARVHEQWAFLLRTRLWKSSRSRI